MVANWPLLVGCLVLLAVALDGMSISASVLKRSMRPRRLSKIKRTGCVEVQDGSYADS
jgi:hypothetical protein